MTIPRILALALAALVLFVAHAPPLAAEDESAAEETAADDTTPSADDVYEWTTPDEQKVLEDTYRKFLEGVATPETPAEGGKTPTTELTGIKTVDALLGQTQGQVWSEISRVSSEVIKPFASAAGTAVGRFTPLIGAVAPALAQAAAQGDVSFGESLRGQTTDIALSLGSNLTGVALAAAGLPSLAASAFAAVPLSLVLIARANPEAFAGREVVAACDLDPAQSQAFSFRDAGRSLLNALPEAPTTLVGP